MIITTNTWWRHQMETFSALLAICAGNSPVTGEFPTQRPVTWHRALIFSLICVWLNDWVSIREAGDLRRYRTHYDVIVMIYNIDRSMRNTEVAAYWTQQRKLNRRYFEFPICVFEHFFCWWMIEIRAKLAQRLSSLVNNNREYRFLTTRYSRLSM